ncbi:hypothetical protein LCGC14_0522890 [marine sediment metagenome]|uniref:Transglutaminase-like domain-containing protein n=1 Tax=marine sediment metagenome TaxID=412755 RepID=A0A0F9SGE6_9ZZZZ
MKASKTEIALYALSGVSLIGAVITYFNQRKKPAEDRFYAPMFALSGGLLVGAGAMSYKRMSSRALAGGLGLTNDSTHYNNGMTLRTWSDPEMDVYSRVELLQGLVASSNKDPLVRKKALAVTHTCPARDDACELSAIFEHNSDPENVRYTGDIGAHVLVPGGEPEAVDTFQTAKRTLEFRGGDCDDHAVLNATMASQNGFDTKFRITSNTGATWDHIYAMARRNGGKWRALDTTLGPGKFGKEPRQAKHLDFPA